MSKHLLFLINILLLIVHEIDAIRCKEWRIFPLLSLLNDKLGKIIFLFAHIPLLFWIFWYLTNNSNLTNFIFGFDIFLILHFALHILFLKHKNNKFNDHISWLIISGAGLFGLIDLIINGISKV